MVQVRNKRLGWLGYPGAVVACGLGLAASLSLRGFVDPAHLLLIEIMCVVGVAAVWGRGPGAFAAILTTLGHDYFFLPPHRSLKVSPPHVLSLVLFSAIALAVGQLAARLRRAADASRVRQENALATARLARDLSGAVTSKQAVEITKERMNEVFGFVPEISLELPDSEESTASLVLPLKAPRKVRGTMRLDRDALVPEDRAMVETFAALCALSLERIHFVEVAHDAILRMEGEKLRSQVLSCLSHDLRTPLTGIVAHSGRLAIGLAGAPGPVLAEELTDLAVALHRDATRMADLVENLLELARLQSGGVRLRFDWHAVDDLCASALRHRADFLGDRRIVLDLPEEATLVWCDGVLVERVVVNLLDNAHRHTPPDGSLRLWCEAGSAEIEIGLDDQGPGIKDQPNRPESMAGGIGLTLCRAIAVAHGGGFSIDSAPGGGARVVLSLARKGEPPRPPLEEDA